MESKAKRLPVIDELRGLAIILVVIYHILGKRIFGLSGVDLFIFDSGFSLAFAATYQPVRDFLKRRFLRLFPAYWFAMVVFLIMERNFWKPASTESILLHVFGLQGFGPGRFINDISPAFWFISSIMLCYAIFLIVRKRIDDIPFMVMSAGFFTFLAAAFYHLTGNNPALGLMAPRIPGFFIGMIAGQVYRKGGFIGARYPISKDAMFFSQGTILLILSGFWGVNMWYIPTALTGIILWIILRIILSSMIWGKRLISIFAALGLVSYEIFVFHQPLVQGYDRWVITHWFGVPDPMITPTMITMETLGALCIVAIVSVSFHRLTKKLTKK